MNSKILKTIGSFFNIADRLSSKYTGKWAFDLFCRPFPPPLAPQFRMWLENAKAGKLNLSGLPIQYYKWGNGENKILFLHGWQSHAYRWRDYIDRLDKNRYTIYAMDAPAHGLSGGKSFTMPLYAKCVEEFYLHVDQPEIIVGHSLGAMTTVYGLAATKSIKPKAVVLLATAAKMSDFLDHFQRALGLTDRVAQSIINHVEKAFGHPPAYFDMVEHSKSLSIPALIIHDPADDVAPAIHAHKMHANWSNSELKMTKGLDHRLRSEVVYDAVLDFIEKQFEVEVV